MLVLYETPAGYALFRVQKEGKLTDADSVAAEFETEKGAMKMLKLEAFRRFRNTAEAVEATGELVEGKLAEDLKKFLKKQIGKGNLEEKLLVGDAKLGGAIAKKLKIQVQSDAVTHELMRGIRGQLAALLEGVKETELGSMALGLSHSLSRFRIKFSPDKVDTMIVQAIGLLDELDKELNTYSMRLKEWYGWHFPELAKIVVDNVAYARTVRALGYRTNAAQADLSGCLPEELVSEVRQAAELSMGTEVGEEDILNINCLAEQVINISAYRTELYEYLKNRMMAIAPNLTVMVGELVGARLIAHAGSLMNLAKYPASTVQILGAEKALFRALKTKNDTPKYGLIYHASLVGQAAPKLKGKISRVLAAKTSLAIRADALGENVVEDQEAACALGLDCRSKVEERLRQLEAQAKGHLSGNAKARPQQRKHEIPAPIVRPSDIDLSQKKRKHGEDSGHKSKKHRE